MFLGKGQHFEKLHTILIDFQLTFGSFWMLGSLKAAIVDILDVILCEKWAGKILELMWCEQRSWRKALDILQQCRV
jgi:hypothetical protein